MTSSFPGTLLVLSGVTHLGNSIYVLLDLFVTAMPVRLFHVIYPSIYAIVYTIFTVIYWAADGVNADGFNYVYKALDWNIAGSTAPLVVGIVFVGTPLVHLVFWSLYVIRVAIHRNCCAEEQDRPVSMDMKERGEPSNVPAVNTISPV